VRSKASMTHTFSNVDAANGTACTDFDASTIGDACQSNLCVGTPATCASANITCPYNQRLNFTARCTPGVSCTQATCCRSCQTTNLVANGAFGTANNWTSTGNFAWRSQNLSAVAGVGVSTSVQGTVSQVVCSAHTRIVVGLTP
jgi:hypothetical protein